MSGLFGDLLKAGLDLAGQNNQQNQHQRGSGGSVLESLGRQVQGGNSLNQGGLMDAIGGMLGGGQAQQRGGGLLGGLLGGLFGGGRNRAASGGLPGGLGNLLGGKKGAMVAGALGMLLSSSAGRKLAGKLVKIGGMGAVGAMAFKAFQNFQKDGGTAEQVSQFETNDFGQTVDQITDETGVNNRSFSIMKAMIAAAKADGQVDAEEQSAIRQQLDQMGVSDDDLVKLKDELTKPLDARDVASAADSPSAAAEMYLVSQLVIDVDSPQEQQYLRDLASALGLNDKMVSYLDQQASQVG